MYFLYMVCDQTCNFCIYWKYNDSPLRLAGPALVSYRSLFRQLNLGYLPWIAWQLENQGSSNYSYLYLFSVCVLLFFTYFSLMMLHSSFVCPQLILFVVKMRVLYVLLASTLSLSLRHQFSLAIPRPCTLKYTLHELVSLNINISSPGSPTCYT